MSVQETSRMEGNSPGRYQRWSDFLWGNPRECSLENRVFNASAVLAGLSGLLALIFNLILDLPLLVILLSFAAAVAGFVFFFLSRVFRLNLAVNTTAVVIFWGILTGLWFVQGGLMGSTGYFYFILITSAIIVIPPPTKYWMTAAILLSMIGLIVLERHFPELLVPYVTRDQKFFDLTLGLLLALLVTIVDVDIVFTQYAWEKEAREEILSRNLRDKKEIESIFKEVDELRGIIPICASCKMIRNDHGFWEQVEKYVYEHSEIKFSHGICPKCLSRIYEKRTDDSGGSPPRVS